MNFRHNKNLGQIKSILVGIGLVFALICWNTVTFGKSIEKEINIPNAIDSACTQLDSWTPTNTTNAPSARGQHTAIWTGSKMIVWGGYAIQWFNSGGQYDPVSDSWTPTLTTGAPAVRSQHTAIWTGSSLNEMIVWGGYNSAYLNTGGRYNISTPAWSPTSTTNAPSGRIQHTAIWTGTKMIIWGGYNGSSYLNDGKIYDPVTDLWTNMSTTNPPSARANHTAVWTGSVMIVWGGSNGSSYLNDGKKYDPVSDTWTNISSVSAPSGRALHTAVWTGTEMIIWGGRNGTNYLNDGARYNPTSDTWITMTTNSAPAGRQEHTAVWTGIRMIVWGGLNGAYLNTGGRYNPVSDSWTPTTTVSAPAGRSQHTAVATGSVMIIWGGYNTTYLSTGGKYCGEFCSAPTFGGIQSAADVNACTKGIQITWQQPSDWGSGATTGTYNVRRYTNSSCSGTPTTVKSNLPATTTSFIDTSATVGTTYYYQILATNDCSLSSTGSNPCSAAVVDQIGTAPSGLTNNTAADVNACTDTGVIITWTADSTNWGDNDSGTRTYNVLRNTTTIASGLAYGATSYIDTTGANGVTYTYKVSYVNGCSLSSTTSGASAADTTGSAPTGLTNNTAADVDGCAYTGVRITWNCNPTNWGDGGIATRTYEVLRNGSSIASGIAYCSTGTTTFIDTTGAHNTTYTYSVKYTNGCSLSSATSGASAADTIGSAPSGLTNNSSADADLCAYTGIKITWNCNPTNWGDGGNGTRSYDVLRDGSTIASGIAYCSAGSTSYIDTTETHDTSYTYSIRYNNGCSLNSTTSGAPAADNATACDLQSSKFIVTDPDSNGVIEPNEIVTMTGCITNNGASTATSVIGTLNTPDPIQCNPCTAIYPDIPPGETKCCTTCYQVWAPSAFRPATHWDFHLYELPCNGCPSVSFGPFTYHVGKSFSDVLPSYLFYYYIEVMLHNNVASGCSTSQFCPESNVQRDQMAKFICNAMNASLPGCCQTQPACAGTFQDVTSSNPFCVYIEALYLGVVSGCNASPLRYCPSDTVTREAMAKFICKAMNVCTPGSCTITSCTGIFTDVPASNPFCGFIEGLYNANVAAGCTANTFCPAALVTRGQMSKFIIKGFGLTL